MAGASYLPWMAGALTERPGQGYWLFGLLYPGRVIGDEEDGEGEIAEDAVEEEVI